MTKLDDAIYNLSKIYYCEIMDFFNNRDEAFFFFFFNKKKETFCIGGLRPWALGLPPSIYKEQPLSFLLPFCSKEQPHLN